MKKEELKKKQREDLQEYQKNLDADQEAQLRAFIAAVAEEMAPLTPDDINLCVNYFRLGRSVRYAIDQIRQRRPGNTLG